jgi:beta-N-acetylhexosaminidase
VDDFALRRAIRATLMPGFTGPDLPVWLGRELGEGLGSVCLFGTNIVDAGQVRTLTDAIHAANPAALVTTDEEGGDVTRLHHHDGSPHPAMAYLGNLDDVAVTTQVAGSIGAELVEAGIDLNLAPVADVNSNPRNPVIGVRSFGADAELVARHVAAYTRGLQAAGVGAVAKHFPGHGDTATDSHHALPTITGDASVLAGRELVPFRAAVQAGTLAVMTSHILVPAIDPHLPATLSGPVLSVLRDELGFRGALISDALDMAGASAERGIPEAAVLALAAGVDLLCIGTDNTADQLSGIVQHVLQAVRAGRLPEERVMDAAARVEALSSGVAALRDASLVPREAPQGPDDGRSPYQGPLRSSGRGTSPERQEGPADRSLTKPHQVPPPLSPAGFWLRQPVTPVVAPVLLRLESPHNMAAGATPWGVGEHLDDDLSRALPGATCLVAADLPGVAAALDASVRRPLVVQGRDLARVEFLATAADMVLEQRHDAVIVDLGWPDLTGGLRIDIATFGAGRATATCLIHLLAEGTR